MNTNDQLCGLKLKWSHASQQSFNLVKWISFKEQWHYMKDTTSNSLWEIITLVFTCLFGSNHVYKGTYTIVDYLDWVHKTSEYNTWSMKELPVEAKLSIKVVDKEVKQTSMSCFTKSSGMSLSFTHSASVVFPGSVNSFMIPWLLKIWFSLIFCKCLDVHDIMWESDRQGSSKLWFTAHSFALLDWILP